jgi:hypothetical protein
MSAADKMRQTIKGMKGASIGDTAGVAGTASQEGVSKGKKREGEPLVSVDTTPSASAASTQITPISKKAKLSPAVATSTPTPHTSNSQTPTGSTTKKKGKKDRALSLNKTASVVPAVGGAASEVAPTAITSLDEREQALKAQKKAEKKQRLKARKAGKAGDE